MTMKIKLTQEQASFIEGALTGGFDKEEILNRFARSNCFEKHPNHSLHGLCAMDLARALLIGYEVEPQYEVGDWITKLGGEMFITEKKVVQVDKVGEVYLFHDFDIGIRRGDVRHATPEEVAQEKEKRFWKSIGREVGEFKEGDIGISRSGQKFSHLNNLKNYRDYLVGFYPIESFVSFGGDEE